MIVDMEGISGVYSERMVRVGATEWSQRTRQLATAEVNVLVEGAIAGGAARVWIQDGHDAGENLLSDQLHEAAELIVGAQAVADHMPGLDDSFDKLFLVGFHARMGTPHALMDHSVTTTTVSEIRFNEMAVGEIGIYAAYAGLRGIPTSLITGDAAAVEEAKGLLGEIEAVAVMDSYGRATTRIRSPKITHPQLRAAAERAVHSSYAPWKPETPLHLAIDFLRSSDADMAEMVPGTQRTGARTVEYVHDDYEMVFKALKSMIYLGGIAAHRWASTIYTTGFRTG